LTYPAKEGVQDFQQIADDSKDKAGLSSIAITGVQERL
jgi:hypothetical protein